MRRHSRSSSRTTWAAPAAPACSSSAPRFRHRSAGGAPRTPRAPAPSRAAHQARPQQNYNSALNLRELKSSNDSLEIDIYLSCDSYCGGTPVFDSGGYHVGNYGCCMSETLVPVDILLYEELYMMYGSDRFGGWLKPGHFVTKLASLWVRSHVTAAANGCCQTMVNIRIVGHHETILIATREHLHAREGACESGACPRQQAAAGGPAQRSCSGGTAGACRACSASPRSRAPRVLPATAAACPRPPPGLLPMRSMPSRRSTRSRRSRWARP